MIETITNINSSVNGIVWGTFGIALLFIAGLLMTIVNKGFQFTRFTHWIKKTIGAIFKDKKITAHTSKENKAISQFQSLCTALAATIGTGNIVGVATAIILGGPGAIFWMWIMAIFGMMTNYSENVLGIYFRRKGSKGEWHGGAMYYLKDGLGKYKGFKHAGTVLAVLFSLFCLIASFGIGNMSQVNSIAGNMESAFNVPTWISGIILLAIASVVILGGLKRVAAVTEKLVPFMAVIYILGALVIFFTHISSIPVVFTSIIKGAFGLNSAAGGITGYGIQLAITWGFKRGAFSNEAGLGSSVMVHSSSNVKEPVRQGMWGIFEVFADTIIVCSLTAFAILSTGLVDLETGKMISTNAGSGLVGEAFATVFGSFGPKFIAIAILLFAFSTVLGWSHYGATAWQYLFGEKTQVIYKIAFVVMIFFGSTMSLSLAWDLSDTFNGLMMIPNLIGVISLSPLVAKITKNYVDRKIHKKDLEPMISNFPEYQEGYQSQDED
ncbi:sodium:alanine symporter family protein [Treponema sp.]|uniref:alanine/glycine:cation symporter family protein n=1 Tax=Treponema sp. TaxID=166 RepID=UPI0025DF3C4D|nr:alanine/glycine:cation symporter family protein [Treponema sp.]MCR5217549.1 alanine:cation symporter family protein [Treponema sp.]